MTTAPVSPRTILIGLLVFILGGVAGYFVRDTSSRVQNKRTPRNYIERHEGQAGLTNPLLACDAADNIVSNPDLVPFKAKIEELLNTRMDKRWPTRVSVYFRELNDGYWFSIGDTESFIPASLRKVPLMIALLKQAESDKGFLERKLKFDLANDYNLNQNIKPSQTLVFGSSYPVRELIYRMIVYSDNNAFTYLTKIVDPALFERVYATVRMQNPHAVKDDEYLSVQTYESFFRVLYNASFLNREASQWALDILSKSEFRTGLVAGVPQGVTVSHKFGEKSDVDGTVQLHDCGVVYYPKNPYLLCIMSKGPNFELLDDAIAEISRITFMEVDQQQKRKP